MQIWILLYQIFAQTIAITCQPVFWLVILILTIQNSLQLWHRQFRKTRQKQTASMLPAFLFTVLEQVLLTVFIGYLGGIIASCLFLLTGVFLNVATISFLWLIMIVLYCIRPRFLCFAYAGGFLALLQSITGWFSFDSRQPLLLVAILHFTESFLVRISGTLQSKPVYLRSQQGNLRFGSQLQMTWPIPLAMPMSSNITDNILLQNGCIVLPDWWPLFAMTSSATDTVLIYHLMPMLAMIGYQDTSEWGAETKQSQKVSRLLFLYSMLLFITVCCSNTKPFLLPLAAILSIFGHEEILHIGNMHMRKYVHIK